jgi:hypothetical protein
MAFLVDAKLDKELSDASSQSLDQPPTTALGNLSFMYFLVSGKVRHCRYLSIGSAHIPRFSFPHCTIQTIGRFGR